MKKAYLLILTILVFNIFACKDDDCHPVQNYTSYGVDFYTSHKDFIARPTLWETVTEQYLSKEAHLEGALFETVTEQILVKESSKVYQIMDSTVFHIVTNSKTDFVTEVACYHFFDPDDFIEIDVPAEYRTITKLHVTQQGTGAEVPATYSTLTRRIIALPAELKPNPNPQTFKRVGFKIPEERSIQAHLGYSFTQHNLEHCIEGNSYRIVE